MAFENWDRLVNEARQRKEERERTNKEKHRTDNGSGRGSRPQTGTANKKGITKRDTLKHPDRIKENPA